MRRSDFAGLEDLRAMQQMCSRLWTPTSRFHPGQLAWNHCHPARSADPSAAAEAIALWREGPRVVGFGWAEAPDWLELQVDPARPEVAHEVVEWFEEWSDAEEQSALVMEGDISEPALLSAGFAPQRDAWHLTHHLLDLTGIPDVPAVAGYAVRPVTGPSEAAARAACHAESWHDFGPSSVTEDSYAALMRTWPYRTDLDWVAVDRAGGMVASCLVWLDPATGVGLLEPVGTVPGQRGRGLARLVTLAALTRLRAVRGRLAVVTARGDADHPGPRRLFQSLGFRPVARTVTWTRSSVD